MGSRGSALARRQTDMILARLREALPMRSFEAKVIQTDGDRIPDRPVAEIGDKGIFVRAIESALLSGDISLAVHSLKDVPGDEAPPNLELIAFSPREDPRDVLISPHGTIDHLPTAAKIGTGSLRRRVQLRAMRPDIEVSDIRGNIDTRLRKLDEGQFDGIVLAAAGLARLGLQRRVSQYFSPTEMVPDAGQGIVAVQARSNDPDTRGVSAIDDSAGRTCAWVERAVVRILGADCRSPVGVYASIHGDDQLRVLGMASNSDGADLRRVETWGAISNSQELVRRVADHLMT